MSAKHDSAADFGYHIAKSAYRRPRRRSALDAARTRGYHPDAASFDERGRLWLYWSSGLRYWHVIDTCSACGVPGVLTPALRGEAGKTCNRCRHAAGRPL
jgi:hypothetical protein